MAEEHEGEIPDGTIVGVMLKAKTTSNLPYRVETEEDDLLASDVVLCTRAEAETRSETSS